MTASLAVAGPAGAAGAAGSVAEVAELEGDAEVLLLHGRDGGLEVVALLAGHPQLLTLDLRLHALQLQLLDEPVERPGLLRRDARDQLHQLAGRTAGRLL